MKPIIKITTMLLALALCLLTALAGPAGALTSDEALRLLQSGLSDRTVADLTALSQDKSRRRAPVMTYAAVDSLIKAGFSDELIGKLAQLDHKTGLERNMPLPPAEVIELKRQGVNFSTIGMLIESELLRGAQGAGYQQVQPGRTVNIGPTGKGVITYRSGGPTANDVGQTVVTRPNGSKAIVYYSGGGGSSIGKQLLTRSDGRQYYLYYTGDPNQPAPDLEAQQREQLEEALRILDRIHVNPYRLMKGNSRGYGADADETGESESGPNAATE